MHTNTSRHPRGGSRGRAGSSRRPSTVRPAQSRQFNRGRPTQRRSSPDIHYSRFINRATDQPQNEEVFVPTYQYAELPLDADLKRTIAHKGYSTPTPIQDGVIPHILQGKDIVGIANTGTGKTAAFLIPLIQKVKTLPHTRVIIVTPTRELAIQIDDELRALSRGMRLYSVVCVGGVNINPQLRALRQRNEFVVGTPGRIKDLIDRNAIDLSQFDTIVLDEADRMLDMGFINDMRFIMDRMPEKRQTLFFSATMSRDIERVIGDFLTDPIHVSVKKRDTSKNVDQDVRHIKSDEHKLDVLHNLLSQPEYEKVLVFGRTKHGVEKLAKSLERRGVRAESIHGNKDHKRRVRALDAFKQGRAKVLVATDVAARGLDIPRVSHVINYDPPLTYEDYVHRIGRTGRADASGKAITFIGNGMRAAQAEANDLESFNRPQRRPQRAHAQRRPAFRPR